MVIQYRVLIFGLLICALVPEAQSQKKHNSQLREDIDLPPDFSIDFQLATSLRTKLQTRTISGTQYDQIGDEVFRTLVENSTISSYSLPYRWQLSFDDTADLNAHSLPDGEVTVNAGLAQLVGSDRGLWAAVLSHEIAHVARRHAVKKYLYQLYVSQLAAYYEARVRAGDNSANWALLGLRIAAPIASAKLSRNLEHEADIQGMLLMAKAGYHPDSVFALHHLLRLRVGDSSKFAAFFQDHPRWETRDQRSERAYADALAEFNRLWPDPSRSSGGQPPIVAFAGNPTARENKENGTADVELPLYCRNANQPLNLIFHFSRDKHELQAASDEYKDPAGNLTFRQAISCHDKDDMAALTVHLPSNLVLESERKATAQVLVLSATGDVLERFKNFDVHFPKGHATASKITPAVKTMAPPVVAIIPERGVHPTPAPPTQVKSGQESLSRESPSIPTQMAGTVEASRDKIDQSLDVLVLSDGVHGVKIVAPGSHSPLAEAGLVVGDIITAVNGSQVKTEQDLAAQLANLNSGSRVEIDFTRSNKLMRADVTVR